MIRWYFWRCAPAPVLDPPLALVQKPIFVYALRFEQDGRIVEAEGITNLSDPDRITEVKPLTGFTAQGFDLRQPLSLVAEAEQVVSTGDECRAANVGRRWEFQGQLTGGGGLFQFDFGDFQEVSG